MPKGKLLNLYFYKGKTFQPKFARKGQRKPFTIEIEIDSEIIVENM